MPNVCAGARGQIDLDDLYDYGFGIAGQYKMWFDITLGIHKAHSEHQTRRIKDADVYTPH